MIFWVLFGALFYVAFILASLLIKYVVIFTGLDEPFVQEVEFFWFKLFFSFIVGASSIILMRANFHLLERHAKTVALAFFGYLFISDFYKLIEVLYRAIDPSYAHSWASYGYFFFYLFVRDIFVFIIFLLMLLVLKKAERRDSDRKVVG